MGVLPVASILVAIGFVLLGVVRPQLFGHGAGKLLGLAVLVVYPVFVALMGTGLHIEHSKTVAYCTSCHAMEKYGKSLHIDNPRYLPAAHVQNGRVPRETACFACHTTYTMYGDFAAKMKGLQHVWVAYFGTIPEKIKLYEPYNNRECLHCHNGTRGFEDTAEHKKERERIQRNELSCLSAECHPTVHAVDELDDLKMWPGKLEATP
jgi:nitrate/TMAO reductase-like tetraheme cytochrome c subunit